MARQNLEFLQGESYTPKQFMLKEGAESLEIKKNHKNGGTLFFTCGTITGAVSSKAASGELTKPIISKVKGDPTERNPTGIFFLLHQQGEGGAETVATFTL